MILVLLDQLEALVQVVNLALLDLQEVQVMLDQLVLQAAQEPQDF